MNQLFKSLLILIICIACCSCATQSITHGIPNFDQFDVCNYNYRGGQPTYDGWVYLQNLGITNVVKLNTEAEGSDAEAKSIGMTVHEYPIDFLQQIWTQPDSNLVIEAINCITSNTFVHCEHGQDRTGLIVGCKRIQDGWAKSEAENEMLQHGFHKYLFGLWKFWKRVE